jgi:TFIIF-interacting CTD phosphatase-like protein
MSVSSLFCRSVSRLSGFPLRSSFVSFSRISSFSCSFTVSPVFLPSRSYRTDDSQCSYINNRNPSPLAVSLIPPPHPSDSDKIALALDLDETLIHSEPDDPQETNKLPTPLTGHITQPHSETKHIHPLYGFHYDFYFDINESIHPSERYFVSLRPHLKQFLLQCEKEFELFLFTASLPIYANPIIDYIEYHIFGKKEMKPQSPSISQHSPSHELSQLQAQGNKSEENQKQTNSPSIPSSSRSPSGFRYRLYRDSCSPLNLTRLYMKDLRYCGRSLKRICIVDNHRQTMTENIDNGILIKDYHGIEGQHEHDKELLRVLKLLTSTKQTLKVQEENYHKKIHKVDNEFRIDDFSFHPQRTNLFPVPVKDWAWGPDIRDELVKREAAPFSLDAKKKEKSKIILS